MEVKISKQQKKQGQSLVEFLLVVSILLLLLTGMVEFGNMLNQYINLVDAARNGAREAAANDPIADPTKFFTVIPDLTEASLQNVKLDITPRTVYPTGENYAGDDIIVSVYSILSGGTPKMLYSASKYGNQTTRLTIADIQSRLVAAAPNTGLVAVEIIYGYPQILKLPIVTTIMKDPVVLYAYAIMPETAAEPTPTP